jgi:hypothetical protein
LFLPLIEKIQRRFAIFCSKWFGRSASPRFCVNTSPAKTPRLPLGRGLAERLPEKFLRREQRLRAPAVIARP